MNLDIDDPRLTAFALGELPEAERPDIEKALADHPDLAREVEQIRLTARWLSERLHEEQAREAVAAAPPLRLAVGPPRTPWYRRPAWLSAAAAVLVLGVSTAVLMPRHRTRPTLPGGRYPQSPRPEVARELAVAAAPATEPEVRRGRPAATAPLVVGTQGGGRSNFDDASGDPAQALAARDRPAFSYYYGDRELARAAPAAEGMTPTASVELAQQPVASASRFSRQGQPSAPAATAAGSEGRQAGQAGQPAGQAAQPSMNAGPLDGAQPIGIGGVALGMAPAKPGQANGPSPLTPRLLVEQEAAALGRVDKGKAMADPLAAAPVDIARKQNAAARQEKAEGLAVALQTVNGARSEVAPKPAQPEVLFEREAKADDAALALATETAPAPIVAENPFVLTSQEAASTFAIDVDTASYSIVRRSLTEQNRLPNPDEVRIEEMLNYFPYQDAPPPAGSPDPFAIHVEPARCPWNGANRLARIGIMGRPLGQEARKPSNLVFLVDVSGSMDQPNKLPLVQWGLQKLVEQLGENDRVAIAVYAGSSGLVLPSTSAMNKPAILSKIEELRAGGSTNGGAGIQLAYDQAAAGFIRGGVNRVILATDGDFNVGVTNQDELVRLVEAKAKGEKPIFLTVLGFGMDNLKDGTLETLADKGNGHYAYIDRPEEAYKVLVEEMGATLDVIAKDVKIQVEFKPELVRAYRLVGYENRVMPNQDFRDDRKDGGEIGAGHHVTALYEYVPAEAAPAPPADGGPSPASFTVRLRYKQPQGEVATEIERPVVDRGVDYADASDDFKFASAVAGFGMILRHSPSVGSLTLPGVIELASPTLAHDPGGYRREFMALVQRARDIQSPPLAAPATP